MLMQQPATEDGRLDALHSLRILDTAPERSFDALCRTAQRFFSVPIALVSLVESDRQWFKAKCGLDVDGTSREVSFCSHTIGQRDVLTVEDARLDPRFATNPLVTGPPGIVFYAGAPLVVDDHFAVGSLCIIDTKPRAFSADDQAALSDLAAAVAAQLVAHRDHAVSVEEADKRRRSEDVIARQNAQLAAKQALLDATLTHMDQGLITLDENGVVQVFNDRVLDILDLPRELLAARPTSQQVLRFQVDRGDLQDSDETFIRWLEAYRVGSERYRYERRRADGRIVEVCNVPLASGGEVRTYSDVTARKHAEAELKRSEAHYRSLAEGMPHLVWITDPGGDVLYMNATAGAYFGANGSTLKQRLTRVHPDDHDLFRANKQRALASGKTVRWRARLLRADTSHRWHQFTSAPMRTGSDDVPSEWLHTALDVDDLVRAREALEETTALLRLAMKSARAGGFLWDAETATAYLSEESLAICGLDVDTHASGIADAAFRSYVDESSWAAIQDAVALALAAEDGGYEVEFRIDRHGETRWIHAVGNVVRDAAGVRIVGLNMDATDRKNAEVALRAREQALRMSEERLALALEVSSGGMWDWTIATNTVWVDDGWHRMLGRTAPASSMDRIEEVRTVHPDDVARRERLIAEHLAGETSDFDAEYRVLTDDGRWIWVHDRASIVERDSDDAPARMIGFRADITAMKDAEREAHRRALEDPLTGLANRRAFTDRLGRRLAEMQEHGTEIALLFLDLDRFKTVNDTFGHPVGDALLREVTKRLEGVIGKDDTLARLGGDEFAILQVGSGQPDAAVGLAERVTAAVTEHFVVSGNRISIGISIGIAVAGRDAEQAGTLCAHADLALYRAKRSGRNTFRLFDSSMDASQSERRRLELELRDATREEAFELHFQPQLDLVSDTIAGFEALVRWRNAERGLVSPGRFIPIAEETGLIVPIGEFVLREACRQASTWPAQIRLAVNISPVQFLSPGLVDAVRSALAASAFPAERLELEITENVLIEDEAALITLDALRDLGVAIALDDFGSGYSSLNYLMRFPFDKIKVDRSFVSGTNDAGAAVILRTIVDLGRRLGIPVCAEGVETTEQLEMARSIGCAMVQGFLIGHPSPNIDDHASDVMLARDAPRRESRGRDGGGAAATAPAARGWRSAPRPRRRGTGPWPC